jgi:membrane protease YdiL (CAAX protease family)
VVFGVGHLPVALLVVPHITLLLAGYVIAANSVFGLVAGYLYWKKGLESAMIAHIFTHLVILTASYFGAYF